MGGKTNSPGMRRSAGKAAAATAAAACAACTLTAETQAFGTTHAMPAAAMPAASNCWLASPPAARKARSITALIDPASTHQCLGGERLPIGVSDHQQGVQGGELPPHLRGKWVGGEHTTLDECMHMSAEHTRGISPHLGPRASLHRGAQNSQSSATQRSIGYPDKKVDQSFLHLVHEVVVGPIKGTCCLRIKTRLAGKSC